jgi:hypothetical protein
MDMAEQLERLRRLTLGLTIVPAVMATIVFALLTLFGRPDIGAIAVSVIFGPMIALAWWDYLHIAKKARAYLRASRDAAADSAGE